MPKLRLNKSHRELLIKFATDKVVFPEETALIQKAEAQLTGELTKLVQARYPEKDMAVLKKYGCLYKHPVYNIKIGLKAPDDSMLYFVERDKSWLLPLNTHSVSLPVSVELLAKYKGLDKAKEALKEKIETILKAYRNLISTSRYYEDVCDAWPEANEMSVPNSTGTAVMDPSILMTIKLDIARRS